MTIKNVAKWAAYIRFCDQNRIQINNRVSKFNARFRLAYSFSGLLAPGMSGGTLRTYNSATKIAFSYSALEALEKAIIPRSETGSHRFPIYSEKLVASLKAGELASLIQLIAETEDNEFRSKRFLDRVEHLARSETDGNTRAIAEGIRNVVFHGLFTSNGSGSSIRRVSTLSLLDNYAYEILDTAEDQFGIWLDKQISELELHSH